MTDKVDKPSGAWLPPAPLGEDGSLTLDALPLAPAPDEVEATGIMFRGAVRKEAGPAMPYQVTRKDLVWADNLAELIERAKRRQWNATTDIPWQEGRRVKRVLEEALADVLTWMVQQEYAAWYVPGKFLTRIHPAYSEVGFFLSSQVMDEARHVEVFLKRLYLNGVGLREVTPSTESSIKGLLAQEDYAKASFLLHILGEGTFKDLFQLLIEIAPDEATRQIMIRSLEDEARHVAYGVGRLRTQLAAARDPDRVGEAFVEALEQRLSFTYEVSGLPHHVQEALAVLAGGDRSPAALDRGRLRVKLFVAELNAKRKQRLLQAGFSEALAEHISQLHIRSAGGLM
ncbi:MAG TPA: ferritin-like domain-containing protein [Bacillota bacterium]